MEDFFAKTKKFETEAENLFGGFEGNRHKISEAAEKVSSLEGESFKPLFEQALTCLMNRLYNAAIMMAWIGTMEFLHDLSVENVAKIKQRHNNFPENREDIQNQVGDYLLIERLKECDVITKNRGKNLYGLLNKRNGACHPSEDEITQTEALSFVHETIKEIQGIKKRNSN